MVSCYFALNEGKHSKCRGFSVHLAMHWHFVVSFRINSPQIRQIWTPGRHFGLWIISTIAITSSFPSALKSLVETHLSAITRAAWTSVTLDRLIIHFQQKRCHICSSVRIWRQNFQWKTFLHTYLQRNLESQRSSVRFSATTERPFRWQTSIHASDLFRKTNGRHFVH